MGQGASIGGVEIEKPDGASIEDVTNANVALVFVKPHASNESMIKFVKDELTSKKMLVLGEVGMAAEAIEAGGFVDKHYAGICAAAMTGKVGETITVSDEAKEAFRAKFEGALGPKSFDDIVGEGCIINAQEAMEKFGEGEPMTPKDLFAMWNLAEAKGAKLAPGVYARLVQGGEEGEEEEGEGKPLVWVINGFYPLMRSKYHEEEASIHLFVVAFKPDEVSWAAFRNDVIGATNPASAAEGSLRASCKAKFGDLGLKEEPNNTDNCVHASAGPLEGLKERMTWLGWELRQDPTGAKTVDVCLDKDAGILELLEDPPIQMYGLAGSKTAFDLTEEKDTKELYVLANNYTFKDELADYIK